MKKGALAFIAVLLLAALALLVFGRPLWNPLYVKLTGGQTIEQVIETIGPNVQSRLMPRFEHAGADYPPKAITLIGFKEEKVLEVWSQNHDGQWRHFYNYPVLAASGTAGPKLREGDKQVPEGLYEIEGLNPNSSYHLSMKINYPNAFDLQHAQAEGRDKPGTNIFIHGKAASVGCLAMGDPAIEELFILVATVGKENTRVILLPHDPATRPLAPTHPRTHARHARMDRGPVRATRRSDRAVSVRPERDGWPGWRLGEEPGTNPFIADLLQLVPGARGLDPGHPTGTALA